MLDAAPFVLLGRASYSIYIVQQAICIPSTHPRELWFQQAPWSPLIAIAVGTLLFALVEEPARRSIVRRFGLSR